MNVTVGRDKPLARLIVVRHLRVDKGQVLQSGILDTSFSLCVLLLKKGLTQDLRIGRLYDEALTSHAIDWRSCSNFIFGINSSYYSTKY